MWWRRAMLKLTMSGSKRRSWSKVFKCRHTEYQRREDVAVITSCHLYLHISLSSLVDQGYHWCTKTIGVCDCVCVFVCVCVHMWLLCVCERAVYWPLIQTCTDLKKQHKKSLCIEHMLNSLELSVNKIWVHHIERQFRSCEQYKSMESCSTKLFFLPLPMW